MRKRLASVQGDRAEELRSLAFLSGILGAFAMDALLQLDFDVRRFSHVTTCGYGLTLGITVCPAGECPGHAPQR